MRAFVKIFYDLEPQKRHLPTCSLTGISHIFKAYPRLKTILKFQGETRIVPKGFGGS